MRGSLWTKLLSLSPEQMALLGENRERWTEIRRSTAPADREAAEHGVRLAYLAAGHLPPQHIVWCASPIEMAKLWGQTPRDQAGANVRTAVVNKVRNRVADAIWHRVQQDVLTDVVVKLVFTDTLGETIAEAVIRGANAASPRISPGVRWLSWPRAGLRDTLSSRQNFRDSGYSQHDLAWLGVHEYFRDVCGLERETEPLRGLLQIAANVGWILPHKHICWVADRPNSLRSDPRGRLHSAAGPALQFRDGWSVYAWKGVEVPRHVIDQPQQITMMQIDGAPDIHIRRCMIERLTPARYVATGGAAPVSTDETGILWRRRWRDGDVWAAVEVVNGTPESDGMRKHYFLQVPPEIHSARAAVAWTYGLNEHEYRGLILRR
jgi:hypothetical protein